MSEVNCVVPLAAKQLEVSNYCNGTMAENHSDAHYIHQYSSQELRESQIQDYDP